MTEWTYKNKQYSMPHTTAVGFVYVIENIDKNKKYIGKKLFDAKGKWRKYTGSSNALNKDIATGDKIKKTIVAFGKNKSELAYKEIELQIKKNVLYSDDFYNEFVGCRINARGLK